MAAQGENSSVEPAQPADDVPRDGVELKPGPEVSDTKAETNTRPTSIGLPPAAINVSMVTLETDSDFVDGSTLDADSALGSLRSSAGSRSVTESVTDYRFEHGRRYHSDRAGNYYLPNDEHEQDRLDLQQHLFRMALDGRTFFSPLPQDKIRNILDIGCGTGIWCIETADMFPNAKVEGIDISPIQPIMVPPNCSFYVEDCDADWVRDEEYDLIHTSAMTLAVRDWPRLVQQVYAALRPGGYFELHEFHGSVTCRNKPDPPDPCLVQVTKYIDEGFSKMGREFHVAPRLGAMLQDAGFVDVGVTTQDWPIGTWARGRKNKEMGLLASENFKDAARNATAIFTRVLGWQVEEYQVFSAKLEQEMRDNIWHLQTKVYFIHGRKPEAK